MVILAAFLVAFLVVAGALGAGAAIAAVLLASARPIPTPPAPRER